MVSHYVIPGLKMDLEEKQRFAYRYIPKHQVVNFQQEAVGIIAIICERFDVPVREVLGKSRKSDLVYVRDWCFYFLWRNTKLPITAIGKLMGRDHTTALYSKNKVFNNIHDKTYTFHEKYVRDEAIIKIALNEIVGKKN